MQTQESRLRLACRCIANSATQFLKLSLCSSAIMTTGFVTPTAAQVQRSSLGDTCFMVTSSGRRLNLGSLCGDADMIVPQVRPSSSLSQSDVVRLKIKKRYASTPVIEVSFNGQPFEMIFDTGASSTLITQSMANALSIQPTGYREVIIADGSIQKMPVSAIQQVSAGGLTSRNLEVTIAGQADVGLLGHDFFGNYDIKIKRDEIELHPQRF